MPSKAIKRHPKTYYPYTAGEKIWRSTHLTEMVCAYQNNKENREILFQRLSYFVYSYPVDKRLLREDEAAEFLIYFRPTIDYIIDRFRFQGYPVEQYLIRCIRFRIINFRRSQKCRNLEQMVIDATESEICYQEQDYETVCCEPSRPLLRQDSSTRRWYVDFQFAEQPYSIQADKLLMLVLRHALVLPISLIDKFDTFFVDSSLTRESVAEMITRVRWENRSKLDRLQKLKDSRSRLYAELIRVQTDLLFSAGKDEIEHIRRKLTVKEVQYKNIQRRIREQNIYISHQQIASVLGIPKGTVDSGLFYLRKKHKTLLDALS
jgi:hypothetical protein